MVHSLSKISRLIFALLFSGAFLLLPGNLLAQNSGASLFISPPSGTFNVGDVFSVNVVLNTNGNSINAVEAHLEFPPDKLQVVSPSVGKSFISVWVNQPEYSNTEGTLSYIGTIPSPGINTSQGVLSTATFRVKSTGRIILKIGPSKVLLNDGKGTNILSNTSGGVYDLVLPPPAGPAVSSPTHPDQGKWYPNNNISFIWASDLGAVAGYSYVLDREPVKAPDDISDGLKESVSYANVSDGSSFFHIKALRGGVWGGISHYGVNIDTTPPAAFKIDIQPRARTTSTKPIINFQTTDALSGLSHYEIKIVPLSVVTPVNAEGGIDQNFFIEAGSPYIPELTRGSYSVIVRAYDNAGNFREVSEKLVIGSILVGLAGWLGDGWLWVVLILLLLLLVTTLYHRHYKNLHKRIHDEHAAGALNSEEIAKRIKELQALQAKYAKAAAVVLFILSSFFFSSSAIAQSSSESLPSPLITTYQEHSTNDEIFYVGGKNNISGSDIVIFVQNEESGERLEFMAKTNERGEWFYSHDQFLSPGNYQMWAQARRGGVESPPSSQASFDVSPAVIRLGASRISFEVIYLLVAVILLIAIIVISILAYIHRRELKRKQRILMNEVKEAEESIRRGFALLKRDIEDELRLIHNIKISRQLASEETAKEKLLLDDLARVESEIGKEVWDIKLKS